MNGERRVGGLWCHEVLEHLSDYLDEVASPRIRIAVGEHLRECAQCSRFGDEVAAVVTAIRASLGDAEPLPADLLQRVAAAPGEG